MKGWRVLWLLLLAISLLSPPVQARENLGRFDRQVYQWALECRSQISQQFNLLLHSGQLNMAQLFDTFYIPIPGTDPQKFRTNYDALADAVLQPIIDQFLLKDQRLVFVVAVDRNGYLPTHNRQFSRPLTGQLEVDTLHNRTKRIFNDRIGLKAARNLGEYLLQGYSRDTGEEMSDLSVPIFIQNRHWGAVRIGYVQ